MKLEFLCCAQLYAVDQRSNVLSIFGIIEEINTATFPFVMQKLCAIGIFEKTSEETATPTVSIRIAINNQEIFNANSTLNFQTLNRMRALIDINGLVVPFPGQLVVSLVGGETTYGEWKINVKQVGVPQTPQVGSPPPVSAPG